MPQGYKARPEQVILFKHFGMGHRTAAAYPKSSMPPLARWLARCAYC